MTTRLIGNALFRLIKSITENMSKKQLQALTCRSWQAGRPELDEEAENAWNLNFNSRAHYREEEDSTGNGGDYDGNGNYYSDSDSDFAQDSNSSTGSGGDSHDYSCVLNTGELVEYIAANFLCNKCHSKPSFKPTRKGLATSLEVNCNCKKSYQENLYYQLKWLVLYGHEGPPFLSDQFPVHRCESKESWHLLSNRNGCC
jgi:hypothetical protein